MFRFGFDLFVGAIILTIIFGLSCVSTLAAVILHLTEYHRVGVRHGVVVDIPSDGFIILVVRLPALHKPGGFGGDGPSSYFPV